MAGTRGVGEPAINSSLAPPPMFLAAGGMDVMVDMIDHSNPAIKKQAAQAIFEACNDNPSNQQLVQQAGAMPKMVQMLQNSSGSEAKNRAAEAIAAMCSQNRDARVEALANNALEPLVKMLDAGNVQTQENAANALANVIIPRDDAREKGARAPPGTGDSKGKTESKRDEIGDAQSALNDLDGVAKLIKLVEHGVPRVKEAAAAAIANAMVDNEENRKKFQQAGGVGPLMGLLKSGNVYAQENAATALWNAMVDNEATQLDLIRHPHGIEILVEVLFSGSDGIQEKAAGTIWKACVADPSIKDSLGIAIPGLVQVLKRGSPGARIQAAGAIRSACINSFSNKQQLNRHGGIATLVINVINKK